jgi:hypothetical protein
VPIHFIIILIDNFILICFLFKEFLGDDQGNITGIRTVKVDWVKVGIIITLLPGAALGLEFCRVISLVCICLCIRPHLLNFG